MNSSKPPERQPQNPASWLALGEFWLHGHQWTAAASALEQAKRLNLGSAETAEALAAALRGG